MVGLYSVGRWIVRIALVLTAAVAFAMAAPADVQPARRAEPAIWTIQKPNGRTITLFGSIHMLGDADTWRTRALTTAYQGADVIVLETDLDAMRSSDMQDYIARHAANPGSVTLSSLLDSDERAAVVKAAVRSDLSMRELESFRPWFAALRISLAYAIEQGFSPSDGVDTHIAADGKSDGKAFDYFETGREQMDLFIDLSERAQINFLVLGAREIIERPDELRSLVDAWTRGDVAQIDVLMNRGMSDSQEVARALLADRNARWAKKIETFYMKDRNSYLIVVGAGHLAGDDGVPAKLRDAGIDVQGP